MHILHALVDFNLHIFFTIFVRITAFVSPGRPSSKSLSLKVILGPPTQLQSKA